MERWAGKVAIVTGASAGIGTEIAKSLANHGVIVVGLARRLERLQELSTSLDKGKFYAIQCDVRKEEDLLNAFRWTEKELGGVDIMINNAGVALPGLLIDMPTEDYRKTIETNLIAPAICAREAVQSMRKRNVAGHIININSIAGHYADSIHFPINMYGASKYGLTALCSELRNEIVLTKLKIKVTKSVQGVRIKLRNTFLDGSGVSAEWSKIVLLPEGILAFPTPWPDPLGTMSLFLGNQQYGVGSPATLNQLSVAISVQNSHQCVLR